jgi:hypothetical protein
VYDGVSRPGVRIVSFAPMLKHNLFPLPTILETLVKAGEHAALGIPVEIEFAVRLPAQSGEVAEFGFLQIRPLTLSRDHQDLWQSAMPTRNNSFARATKYWATGVSRTCTMW